MEDGETDDEVRDIDDVPDFGFAESQRSSATDGEDKESADIPTGPSARDAHLPHEQKAPSPFKFVTSTWFQSMSACVIITNIVMQFMEMDKSFYTHVFFLPNQATLCFYIFELFSRIAYFRKSFLCGSWSGLRWNLLDIIVVTAGVFDQWVLPFMRIAKDSPVNDIISLLRLLRIARVIKIMRVFLEVDLTWTEGPQFQSFVGGVIGFNAALMGLETDIKWWGWFYIEQVLLVIYVFELLVRIKRFGLFFLSGSNPDIIWNTLDFTIVVSSVADGWVMPMCRILAKQFAAPSNGEKHHHSKGMKLGQVMMLMRMLRLMRILRLVKLVKSVRPLFILVTGVVAAFQGVVWVLVLTVVTLYAAGIMATRLLGHAMIFPPDEPIPDGVKIFKTVPDSMFTLFRFMSGSQSDEEAGAIEELMLTVPTIKFAFIFFMVTSSWTLLSILTAVVSENMISTTSVQEAELSLASYDEDREKHREDLRELFGDASLEIDTSKDEHPMIHVDDINKFLKDPDNRMRTAKVCRVAAHNVVDVLGTLGWSGTEGKPVPVDREKFLETMLDLCNPVYEQSTIQFECCVTQSDRQFEKNRKKIEDAIDRRQNPGCAHHDPKTGIVALERLPKDHRLAELAAQNRQSSNALTDLHASVQSLIGSQEGLVRQCLDGDDQMQRLEAKLASVDAHTSDAFQSLTTEIQDLQQHLRKLVSRRCGESCA